MPGTQQERPSDCDTQPSNDDGLDRLGNKCIDMGRLLLQFPLSLAKMFKMAKRKTYILLSNHHKITVPVGCPSAFQDA